MIYNPIGLTDGRFDRPMTPIDEAYQQTLKSDYQSIRAGLGRYVAHNPKAWNDGVRDLHAHPLLVDAQRRLAAAGDGAGPDRPDALRRPCRLRLGAHPGADARLRRRRGHAARARRRASRSGCKYLAKTIPNGNGRVLLLPGLGHVPHLEAPEKVLPPLVAFLKEGLAAK